MDLRDVITATLNSLPEIQYYTAPDGKQYPEDANIKDILYLADTLKSKFSIKLTDYEIANDHVVDIVEIVEAELIRKGGVNPILRERIKDESKLHEELNNLGSILSKYNFGTPEETLMKAMYMWFGCLSMKKLCRKSDTYGIEPINRLEQHSLLIELSKLNPSIKKGLASAKLFRQKQVTEHPENWDYSWIPNDSPF